MDGELKGTEGTIHSEPEAFVLLTSTSVALRALKARLGAKASENLLPFLLPIILPKVQLYEYENL